MKWFVFPITSSRPLPPVWLSDKHISSGICLSCALLPSPPSVFTLLLPPALAPCPLAFSPLLSFSALSLFPLPASATPADAPCIWGSEECRARKICKQNSGRAAAADGDKKKKNYFGNSIKYSGAVKALGERQVTRWKKAGAGCRYGPHYAKVKDVWRKPAVNIFITLYCGS